MCRSGNATATVEYVYKMLVIFFNSIPLFTFDFFTASQEGNTSVSVVRVNETGGGSSSDINMTVEEIMNPSSTLLKANRVTKQADHNNIENLGTLLDLDKEDFEKIEYALQAEQAGQFFSAELEDLLDPELTGGKTTIYIIILHFDTDD